jgi:hypothetical protein
MTRFDARLAVLESERAEAELPQYVILIPPKNDETSEERRRRNENDAEAKANGTRCGIIVVARNEWAEFGNGDATGVP